MVGNLVSIVTVPPGYTMLYIQNFRLPTSDLTTCPHETYLAECSFSTYINHRALSSLSIGFYFDDGDCRICVDRETIALGI